MKDANELIDVLNDHEFTEEPLETEDVEQLKIILTSFSEQVNIMHGIIERSSNGSCAKCQGWGCRACCNSDAEIRSRQGGYG